MAGRTIGSGLGAAVVCLGLVIGYAETRAEAKPADPGSAAAFDDSQPAPVPLQQTDSSKYPMTGFTPVKDDCKNAAVLLTTSPLNGTSPKWIWIRAALQAHQEFKVGASGRMGVTFTASPTNDSKAAMLIGNCDGATCNRLAAMYKAVVPSSKPQVFCGAVPGAPGPIEPEEIKPRLPTDKDEPLEKCARIGVCTRALDPSGSGDPGFECQKSPSSFKLACATKSTCGEVVSCAK